MESLKLSGIALRCLVVIGIGVFISNKTGVIVPARWWGLLLWASALLSVFSDSTSTIGETESSEAPLRVL